MSRVNEAVMYGAYMLGQSLVYAPSFNSAKACGAKILAIIHRQPKVRTEDGVKDKRDWVSRIKCVYLIFGLACVENNSYFRSFSGG